MKRTTLILNCGLLLFSCGKFVSPDDDLSFERAEQITKSNAVSSEIDEEHYSRIHAIVNSVYSQKKIVSVSCVKEDGDTLLSVVNFDTGWALVTNEENAIVVGFSNTGDFDPNCITNPGVAAWFEMLKEDIQARKVKHTPINSQNRLWPQYWWVKELISETVVSQSVSEVDHLLTTVWGQEAPWNYKCPIYYGNSRCPTGCVAVAMSQILYYLHGTINKPTGFYHDVGFTNEYLLGTNGTFYRGNYVNPSSAWSLMATDRYQPNTNLVGDLMVDVGNRVGMSYSAYQSGAFPTRNAFQYYGVSCDSLAYSFSVVKNSLDNNQPVMIMADPTGGAGKHAWVIDGYHETSTTTDYHYEWHLIWDRIPNAEYEEFYSIEQMEAIDPNIYEGKSVTERRTSFDRYLLMNWGYDSSVEVINYNNGHYYVHDNAIWQAGPISYQPNKWIIYNFN